MVTNFLKELNPEQKAAVEQTEGPSLVIAGAGAGKTRVLTYRIAYLLSKGAPPASVLALTFTNKAAREMKNRIADLIGYDSARHLWMGTFHSIFAKILRIEGKVLGYTSNFTIYDTDDSKSLLKKIIKELKLNDKTYKTGEVLGRISAAKSNLMTWKAYASNAEIIDRDRMHKMPEITTIFKMYATRCFQANAMDFDDLLLNINILFRDNPEILKKYQERFKYVLVDEYQDTNFAQYLIVKKISAGHRQICVVGDDSQSIYAFRGAKIENILNFKNDYPGYQLFKLEQNYRSTKTIVDAANSLIARNKNRIPKKVWSSGITGEKIRVIKALTDREEGNIVANEIIDKIQHDHLKYEDFAILYRTNAQSRIFEEALRKRNIPYIIYGGISFYQRKEIKDLLAYFRLIINNRDEEALRRIINFPARGIGNTTIQKIEQFAGATNSYMWDVLSNPEKYDIGLNKSTMQKIQDFVSLISSFSEQLYEMDAYDLAYYVASSSGILQHYSPDHSPENISKHENLQELLNGIKDFCSSEENLGNTGLDNFMENVALLTSLDNEKPEDSDKIKLMTVHSAKGLEFTAVFVAGVEEELFPNRLSVHTLHELEEERRLMYVAVTRAKKYAYMSFATNRLKWGVPTPCMPSRFIREFDDQFLDLPPNIFEEESEETTPAYERKSFGTFGGSAGTGGTKPKYFRKDSPPPGKRKLTTQEQTKEDEYQYIGDNSENITTGMMVKHRRFGIGKVIAMEGKFPDTKAIVDFQNSGEKQLLLKFAKLKIV